METWEDQIKNAWNNGDKIKAIKIASKFKNLGDQKDAIILAKECCIHPDFYKSIGKDVNKCIKLGCDAIVERFRL